MNGNFKVCSKCSTANLADSVFCANCGNRLDDGVQVNPNNQVNNVDNINNINNVNVVPNQQVNMNNINMAPNQQMNMNYQNNYQQNVDPKNIPETPEEKKNGDQLGLIALILYLVGSGLATSLVFLLSDHGTSNPITSILSLGSIAGIIVMIIGRVKYPKNKLLKIAMWVIIITIILGIILFIFVVIMCTIACNSCANEMHC